MLKTPYSRHADSRTVLSLAIFSIYDTAYQHRTPVTCIYTDACESFIKAVCITAQWLQRVVLSNLMCDLPVIIVLNISGLAVARMQQDHSKGNHGRQSYSEFSVKPQLNVTIIRICQLLWRGSALVYNTFTMLVSTITERLSLNTFVHKNRVLRVRVGSGLCLWMHFQNTQFVAKRLTRNRPLLTQWVNRGLIQRRFHLCYTVSLGLSGMGVSMAPCGDAVAPKIYVLQKWPTFCIVCN